MGLKTDLEAEVSGIFKTEWTTRDGEKVPEAEDLKLGNDAVKLTGAVLYADLADSTKMVDGQAASFAAEIYKSFLHCAAKIIRDEGGTVTAYDGDRVMGVYIGGNKNTAAVRSAMKINFAMSQIVRPALKKQYGNEAYAPRHVVGVDASDLFVARTGVRGANDLVWVGRAANYAAKLSALRSIYQTYITADVYKAMHTSVKTSDDGKAMWTERVWTEYDQSVIYGSSWWWSVE